MSETTSESGQAHLADEPSMEDILDSIRKIIADDDQTMDIAPPQALGSESSQSDSEGPIFAIEPTLASSRLAPSSFAAETVLSPSADDDDHSVFDSRRDDYSDASDDLDETVDLDIEALLSGAETPLESLENLSAQNFMEDDDLTNMLDIQIPELKEDSVSVGPESEDLRAEDHAADILDLSEVVTESKLDLHQDDTVEIAASQDDDDDSLFGQLEGLLANVPQDDTRLDETNLPEANLDETSFDETSDASISELDDFTDVMDLEALFDEALLDGVDDAEAVSDSDIEPQVQAAETPDSPAFHSDEADMDIVKSLMADLTEPEDVPEVPLEQETLSSSEAEEDISALDDIFQEVMDDMSTSSDASVSAPEPLSLDDDYSGAEFDDSDILDDIINMSLDAEMAQEEVAEEDTLQIPEPEEDPLESLAEETEIDVQSPVTAQSLISSLMEIAGAAEHDADEAEATLAAAASENTKNTAAENPEVEVAETSHPETPLKETADMSKAAVNQDRILDEVSGVAATSAFASLNNMVEEKAIKAERGDRIGDLVMEALRPMLKEWLDEHLNDIVERAVTKEVQRISAGK